MLLSGSEWLQLIHQWKILVIRNKSDARLSMPGTAIHNLRMGDLCPCIDLRKIDTLDVHLLMRKTFLTTLQSQATQPQRIRSHPNPTGTHRNDTRDSESGQELSTKAVRPPGRKAEWRSRRIEKAHMNPHVLVLQTIKEEYRLNRYACDISNGHLFR